MYKKLGLIISLFTLTTTSVFANIQTAPSLIPFSRAAIQDQGYQVVNAPDKDFSNSDKAKVIIPTSAAQVVEVEMNGTTTILKTAEEHHKFVPMSGFQETTATRTISIPFFGTINLWDYATGSECPTSADHTESCTFDYVETRIRIIF